MTVFRCTCVSFCSHQRLQLFQVYTFGFSGKVVEMMVAGVDMSFGFHLENPVDENDGIHMCENTEESTPNLLANLN